MNDDFVLRQAKLFAERVQEGGAGQTGDRSTWRTELALGRPPGAKETRHWRCEFLQTARSGGFHACAAEPE